MSRFAPKCGEDGDFQYLAHLNEPNNARDLDLIRSLMDVETIDFYGISDGNMVGITYAGMFPNRVGRFMLDGISRAR
jgi:pimeloyl-ACP methyl ester carboxylesterase